MKWFPLYCDLLIPDENGEVAGMEKRLLRYDLQFSEEEKKIFRDILKKRPPHEVEIFIGYLREVCQNYGIFLKQKKDHEIYDDINSKLRILKNALKEIKQLQKIGNPLGRMKSIPEVCTSDEQRLKHFTGEKILERYLMARNAEMALVPLIKHLDETQPKKPGKGIPVDEGGFRKSIAAIFAKAFNTKPSKGHGREIKGIWYFCCVELGRDRMEDKEADRLN